MRRAAMVVCAALVVIPVVMKSRMVQDLPDHAVFHVLSSGRVSVKVSGDVKHPGVYVVPVNSLAVVAINMAEPLHPLDQHNINSIASGPLLNGSAVSLAVQPDGTQRMTVGQMMVSERMVLGIPLDITTMTEADFDRLPGIGPALAKRIVEYRQNNGGFLRVEDLAAVEGIGEKKYQKIQAYFQPPKIER